MECSILGEVYLNEKAWSPESVEEITHVSTGVQTGRGNKVPLFVGTGQKLKIKVLRCMSASKKDYEQHTAASAQERTERGVSTEEPISAELGDMSCEEIDEDVDPLP